jgi:Right handed beta helix region/Dockerin type I domain
MPTYTLQPYHCRRSFRPSKTHPRTSPQLRVEILEPRTLLATFTVVDITDGGLGSLRQAIVEANSTPGADLIQFNIPGSGVRTINLSSPLPPIQNAITIDGWTQTGFQDRPIIELNGSGVTGDGLTIHGSDNLVRGLIINRFNGNGIAISGINAKRNAIEGNYIGTNADGTADFGNSFNGVLIAGGAQSNAVGGKEAATLTTGRNVISGNNESGIRVAGSDNAILAGNYIGTKADGTGDIGNSLAGIALVFPETVNSVVQNNVVSGNDADGINIATFSSSNPLTNNFVRMNIIGLEADGRTPAPNGRWGLVLDSSGNKIGSATSTGNVISANGLGGILIGATRTANHITGNLIGTDISGMLDRGNAQQGILLDGALGNFIGGSVFEQRNIFSANKQSGIRIAGGSQNSIRGNYIGTRVDGTGDLGNSAAGIEIVFNGATDNLIGGEGRFEGNVISGNGTDGIAIAIGAPNNNRLIGNIIGLEANGDVPLPNTRWGVVVESAGNSIGSATSHNVISGNGLGGVTVINGSNNMIIGNYLGTDISGTLHRGNGSHGILINNGAQNQIGGTAAGQSNIIAGNKASGVMIVGANATSNPVRANSIFANNHLGIDLGGNGVTLNDSMDSDNGPNRLLNFPIIQSVFPGTTTRVTGVVNGAPSTSVTVEFFANIGIDPTGYGEGQRLIGTRTVTTSSDGSGNFEFDLANSTSTNEVITATATDSLGNTSEFSKALGLDTARPTSRVASLQSPAQSRSFAVTVIGSDLGLPGLPASGIESYDIYVSIDGSGFTKWTTVTSQSPTAIYTGESNHSYGFRSIAKDWAGNIETKPISVEASIFLPDLDPPVSEVRSVDTSTSTFQLEIVGVDPGLSGISLFDIYVQVDNAAPSYFATTTASLIAGNYLGSANYAALTDGVLHSYRFYSIAFDRRGNVENAPLPPSDIVVSKTFSSPVQLTIDRFDVQKNATQRSLIRYLDLSFNTSNGVDAIVNSISDSNAGNDRARLRRFNLDGSGFGEVVPLAGKLNWSAVDRVMAFDFGQRGIGGDATSLIGNGYYALELDLDGDGRLESVKHFYRLLGEVNGDRTVNALDNSLVSRAVGTFGSNLNEDINGDGVVTIADALSVRRGIGRALSPALPIDD